MHDKNNIPLNLHCQINTYCPTTMLLQKVFTIYIDASKHQNLDTVCFPLISKHKDPRQPLCQ
jgi:hypothetical protein